MIHRPLPGVVVVVAADARSIAAHLVLAIARYEREASRDGFVIPREVDAVRVWLTDLAQARPHPTHVAQPLDVGEPEDVARRMLLSKREASSLLGVSVRTVERLIARGDLAAVRIGTAAKIRSTDLDDYVERLGSGSSFRHRIVEKGLPG